MSKSIVANAEQIKAIEDITNFLAAPYVADPFYVLEGAAGTGKTFCLREIAAKYKQSAGRLAFTAPTNKAAKVIRALTGEASTIYSLLGLRIQANGEVKELSTKVGEHVDLSNFDGVAVDEGGMVSTTLLKVIRAEALKHNLRFLFLGDRYQLPPVGERESPIWKFPQKAVLTKVERHDNQILKLVTGIREAMDQPIMNIDIKADNDGNEGVWKIPKLAFKTQIYTDAEAGKFSDTNSTKVIAWRNVKTAEYNQIIRRAIFGAAASFYEVGERIIAASPCLVGGEVVLATDDEAIVESLVISRHPLSPEFEAIELKCRTEDNRLIRLTVLHPASATAYANACQSLAHAAKTEPKKWKAYWNMKELFHDVKYAYAITAHRAQGSTYENVYVDYQDILMNRERREAFQCLYVAASRPTKRLILA
jgi:exodeoxyribonuclease-5